MTVAVDAMRASSNPHAFMGVTEQGLAAIVKTSGNQASRLSHFSGRGATLMTRAGRARHPARRHQGP